MALRLDLRTAALLAGLAILLFVPLLGEVFYTRLLTRIMIFGLFALSLDLILGHGGLVSFGHAAFFGIGAYVTGILVFHDVDSGFVVWPLAVAGAALSALLIGAISLRTSGVYFIMITLAFAQMIYYVSQTLKTYGGNDGMKLKTRNSFAGLVDLADPAAYHYVVLAVLLLAILFSHRLVRSRFGRVLRAVKDNERRLRSVGCETYNYKLAAFVIAGAVAGLAGALHANRNACVSPDILHWVVSGDVIVMVVLGGIASPFGPVIGAAAFLLLEETLSSVSKHWMIILGPILLLIVLYGRRGIYGWLARPAP